MTQANVDALRKECLTCERGCDAAVEMASQSSNAALQKEAAPNAADSAKGSDASAMPSTQGSTGVTKPKISHYRRHLLLCVGPRCTQDGQSQALYDSLGERFKAAGLQEGALRVKRSRVSCFAACKGGPIVCVQPDGVWYYNVTSANMDRIIDEHLVHGRVVEALVFHQGPDVRCDDDTP